MGSIPLPALGIQQQQQPDLLQKYGQLQALRNQSQQIQLQQQEAPLRLQALQQGVQSGQLGLQQQQREADSQNAIMDAYSKSNGDLGQAYDLAAKSGKALPGDLVKLRQSQIQMQEQAIGLLKAKGERAVQEADLFTGATDAVNKAPAEQRPAVYQQQIANLAQAGVDVSQVPQQYPGDQQFSVLSLGVRSHKNAIDDAAKQAKTEKDKADAAAKNAETNFYSNPNGSSTGAPGVPIEQVEMRDWLSKHPGKGPSDYTVAIAANKAGAEAAARQPYELALAAQKQALSQGDPKAAGHLMVTGDATLSELKSRGATPDFIAKALFAANKESGGKYNAMAADAQFSVAKSPANVAFFGSAKSLIDKGGTLDQLTAAGKDIPGGAIPVFNSIADWEKAASGSGPIAKYASIALGAADDYAKVMGSGTGSDASRKQALDLFGAKQSPAQRAGSISGVRGAVNSQGVSRIGDNPVLDRMYGSTFQKPNQQVAPTGPPPGATHTAPGSDGKNHYTNDKGQDLGVAP